MLEEFRKMPEVGMNTPGQWMRIKDRLLDMRESQNTISIERFNNICNEEGLNSTSIDALLRFLHNTGNLFYQPYLFQKQIILNQEWALEGLYAVFQRGPVFSLLENAKGRVSLEILGLPWAEYDIETRKIFLSMMESCELCFKITEDQNNPEYIITEFLSQKKDERISLFWEGPAENELFLKYQTNFFHKAFITRFIARAGRLAKNYDYIWRNGIWISYRNAHALIEAFPEEHQILIRVKGNDHALLLYLIHHSFKEIFYEPESVGMEISIAGKNYVAYTELKSERQLGKNKVLSTSKELIDLEEIDFFEDVLDARSEADVKRKLKDIVPKPPLKVNIDRNSPEYSLTPEQLNLLKNNLKEPVGKKLEKALSNVNEVLNNCPLKNETIMVQARLENLSQFQTTGQINFEDYNQTRNQIINSLLGIIDRIENSDLNLGEASKFL